MQSGGKPLPDTDVRAVKAGRADANGWLPIAAPPTSPMNVLYYSATLRIHDLHDEDVPLAADDVVRFDLGRWDGSEFLYACSNHLVFEFDRPGDDHSSPTHYRPLPNPPEPSK